MLLIIGLAVFFFTIIFFVSILYDRDVLVQDFKLLDLFIMVAGIVISVGCYYGLEGIKNAWYEETKQTALYELVSSVSIDAKESLTFIYKDKENEKIKTISTDNITIIKKEGCKPHIVEYTVDIQNTTLNKILAFGNSNGSYNTYELHVPK